MRIAIIGLGLIGGSLGLALKKSGGHKVIGVPRDEKTIEKALALGAIDEGTTDHLQGVNDADLVFICTPINLIVPVVSEVAPQLKKGAIVSDVGSSKYEIVSQLEKLMPKGVYYVGGHPLAGKERFKIDAAEAGLFYGRTWALTRTSRTSQRALDKVAEVVRSMGAKPLEMEPKAHDLVVAAISHAPLAVAAALVNAVAGEAERATMAQCAASGFRDATRIVSGDPILGVDMFTTNKKAVLKMIGAFKRSLSSLEGLIKEGNGEKIREELAKAKQFRDSIYG
ncbi:MAG: prephenate dehydrogenase/arogenate dehydrogenase family protein [Candidatus Margulisbacteria bacterium]|nr:prephenate dehydrogenase/arogenate dehydrogenase family protein [Candidatus Margulisiibacteriota bacterium]MBU1617632.1 prephenate dehydrogenase/arogenate dehydrogenase family protein [Candidatus Margulisiibacteriota bacterium]